MNHAGESGRAGHVKSEFYVINRMKTSSLLYSFLLPRIIFEKLIAAFLATDVHIENWFSNMTLSIILVKCVLGGILN